MVSASIVILSPSSINPITPPSWASGTLGPTTNPWVPPENRPSVIKATFFPSHAPIIAAVGFNISGIPDPTLGPSYRITPTTPFWTLPSPIPVLAAS